MTSNDIELQEEIISFGQYEIEELDHEDLQTVIERAKSHLEVELDIDPASWYSNRVHEEALFWTAMLFSKVSTEQLDARAMSVGAIEESSLLAADDDTVTTWYRNYQSSVDALSEEVNAQSYGARKTARTGEDGNRRYGDFLGS